MENELINNWIYPFCILQLTGIKTCPATFQCLPISGIRFTVLSEQDPWEAATLFLELTRVVTLSHLHAVELAACSCQLIFVSADVTRW